MALGTPLYVGYTPTYRLAVWLTHWYDPVDFELVTATVGHLSSDPA
jgi:hypothetical protein